MPVSHLNAADLAFLCGLLRERTGVVLDDSKDYLVEARLTALASEDSLGSGREILTRLRSANSSHLRQRFAEAMLNKETSFFRDYFPFVVLSSTIIPEVIRRRQAERRMVIWSAGCSTGQEIYSVAMLLLEEFPELASWSVELLASDVSESALTRAKAGRYSLLEVNRGLPVAMLVKYFIQHEMEWHVRDQIRENVRFFPLNLVQPWPALPRVDIVLMRNVLIYFDGETRKKVLEQVSRTMHPDGRVLLGAAESALGADVPLIPIHVNKTVVFGHRDGVGE